MEVSRYIVPISVKNTRGALLIIVKIGLTVASFGNVYLINIFLLRSPRPPPCVTLLSDMEWGNWSDSEIARKAAVTQPYVSKLRTLCIDQLSYNSYKITPDNPEVTPRSFFPPFGGKHPPRPFWKVFAKSRIFGTICEHAVTLRSFFGTFVPKFGTRPSWKVFAKIRISVPICERNVTWFLTFSRLHR